MKSLALRSLPYLAIVMAYLLVAPWGNFPINDDFVYARIVHRLADTGRLSVEGCTASVIGQVLLAAPFVKLFGHSHLVLRLITMVLGVAGLWILGRLLRAGGVGTKLVVATQTLVALNPLYFYSATSFMTELYGLLPALFGAVVYFEGRQRADAARSECVISLPRMAIVALLVGGTFWVRQFCVVAFPALIGATVLRFGLRREWTRLRHSLLALGLGCFVFVVVVYSYFPVARMTGNLPTAFKQSLADSVLSVKARDLVIGSANFLAYMTAFLLPTLALFRWRRVDLRKLVAIGLALVAWAVVGFLWMQPIAADDVNAGATLHKTFPFGGNVLYNAGIGPVTLTDVFKLGLARPRWPVAVWHATGAILIACGALWSAPILTLYRQRRAHPLRTELILFAALFAMVSLAVPLQAFKLLLFDRYYLPSFISLAILLPVALGLAGDDAQTSPLRAAVFAIPFLALALFTVGGVHDQFRWNEARWTLVDRALSQGATARNLDGGYEVNGWLVGDEGAKKPAENCINVCRCESDWWCPDASYRIGMSHLPGYQRVDSLQPAYWLAAGPPVVLEHRIRISGE